MNIMWRDIQWARCDEMSMIGFDVMKLFARESAKQMVINGLTEIVLLEGEDHEWWDEQLIMISCVQKQKWRPLQSQNDNQSHPHLFFNRWKIRRVIIVNNNFTYLFFNRWAIGRTVPSRDSPTTSPSAWRRASSSWKWRPLQSQNGPMWTRPENESSFQARPGGYFQLPWQWQKCEVWDTGRLLQEKSIPTVKPLVSFVRSQESFLKQLIQYSLQW